MLRNLRLEMECSWGSFQAGMGNVTPKNSLAGISLRHLGVFSTVVLEGSHASAALELQMSRTNVKRLCGELEEIVGRPLLEDLGGGRCGATAFGRVIFGQLGPLSTALRKMEEAVKQFHKAGRVLRFGAAAGFFRGGLFTDYLSRLDVSGKFRSCFLKVDAQGAHKTLLAAECDVYFGIGLGESGRLNRVELGEVGWNVSGGKLPGKPKDLKKGWFMLAEGEASVCDGLMGMFSEAGARGGRLIGADEAGGLKDGELLFSADTVSPLSDAPSKGWPCHRFSALMRHHHPYEDLKAMLCAGAGKGADGC